MIKTARQLKDKIRNLSGSNSQKAQSLIRNYIMEEFLIRLSKSQYKNNFILKGGMLVSSIAGINNRATMDIDTTVKAINLSEDEAYEIIADICNVDIEDNIVFHIVSVSDIMEEHDYPGIRFMLEATLENLVQPVKIDISTGDVITPGAIEYSYKPMFDNNPIDIMSYNTETLLAEKLETVVSRGIENTRMRDFYDIHILTQTVDIDLEVLKSAFNATVSKRGSEENLQFADKTFEAMKNDSNMIANWSNYCKSSWFIDELSWNTVLESAYELYMKICLGIFTD